MGLTGKQAGWQNRIVGEGEEAPDQLLANPQNWRIHPQSQQEALAGVLDEVGWVQRVLVNQRTGHLVDGHLRVALAQRRGEQSIPVTYLDLSEGEGALVLATIDPISALATADAQKLDELLRDVATDSAAVQEMLAGLADSVGLYQDAQAEGRESGEDDLPVTDEEMARLVEKWQPALGQLWRIGDCALICGDCREWSTWERLLDVFGSTASGVFTSPPYAEQRKQQYGGIPEVEYVEWWEAVQSNARRALAPDGSFFVNIKAHSSEGERSLYVMDLVLSMARDWGWSFVDEFCWLRSGVPREVRYSFKNGFEPVFHFAVTQKGFKFRPDDVRHESEAVPIPGGAGVGNTNWAGKQGKRGAAASSLQGHSSWIFGGQDYKPGLAYPSNVLKAFSNDETRGHEAAFPPQLPEFFIRAYSDKRDMWIDPFAGSGSTLVAALRMGRLGGGIELQPKYLALMLGRLELESGKEAVLLERISD